MNHILRLAFLLCIFSATLFAQGQAPPLVKVSNDDPKWGETIRVDYTAPDTSRYAKADFHDTLFCAAIINTAWGERNVVFPMERKVGTAQYSTNLKVPDSTYLIRIEIAVPTDRAPNGIVIFTAKQPNGLKVPGGWVDELEDPDSALVHELHDYPLHYEIYVTVINTIAQNAARKGGQANDSLRFSYIDHFLNELNKAKVRNLSWYVTVAALTRQYPNNDDKANAILKEGIEKTGHDEFLYNNEYWNRVFSPAMVNGQLRMPYAKGRALTPLVEKFPTCGLAHTWLQWASYDTLLDAKAYRNVLKHWTQSNDVDLLMSIANGLSNERSTIYDPTEALNWIVRAEHSWQQYTGFRSGENIFGSMGRYGRIMQSKIAILGLLKRTAEAQGLARSALRAVTKSSDKTGIYMALVHNAVVVHDFAGAERPMGIALSMSSQRQYPDIDSVYQHQKQGAETRDEYIKRISKQYSNVEELPALADFEYTTTNGRKGKLSDTKGKIVVLDFWFIGCAGCELEHKSLDEFAKKMQSDPNVILLSVALNDASTLKHYFKTDDPAFPVVASGQAICDNAGITGFPTHVILDQSAKTVMWEMGGSENTGEALAQRVKELEGK